MQGSLTGLWTAAPLWTAGAPDVTAAGVGAALTPANAQEEEDKEDSQTDDNHKQPVCREMRTGCEPGGLGGNRDTDTARQCRDRWGEAICKACTEAVALAGISLPDTTEQQQREFHPSTTQANPKVRERALGSWGQGRKQEVTWQEQRQAVASER